MSLKKWNNQFSQREFKELITAVAIKNLNYFNYTKKPFLIEKKLPNNALMCFYSSGKDSVIAYDYAKFKRAVGNFEYHHQCAYAVQCMAHEMRHYYQHRQITAKAPVEDKKTIEEWKKNKLIKTRGMKKTDNYQYWFSSRELDANSYAYIFALEHVDEASLDAICGKAHFKALKKTYKKQGGKKANKYFSNKVKKIV